MNVNEFRYRYKDGQIDRVAIYKLNAGKEEGCTLEFENTEHALRVINKLKTAIENFNPNTSGSSFVAVFDNGVDIGN